MSIPSKEHLVNIGDTRLFVVERGSGYPIIVLHGGPGLDHHMFGDYLDPLCDQFRLILVDQRAQGRSDMCDESTWTLSQMAKDITLLADAMELKKYAVLGHSYGAFVVLHNAVDYPSHASQTIVSSGLPSAKYLASVWSNLEKFEPVALREQVTKSWEREKFAQTREEAIDTMSRALSEYVIEGVKTTIPFHQQLMRNADFRSGNFTTKFLEGFTMQ